MNCPNCITTFVLRADYADHVQQCRPVDAGADSDVLDGLLVRLNAAAARLQAEFGDVQPNRLTPRLDSAA